MGPIRIADLLELPGASQLIYSSYSIIVVVAASLSYTHRICGGDSQALVVNEFEGETFECDPGAPTSCITTGEQELANLSFEVSHRPCSSSRVSIKSLTMQMSYRKEVSPSA